MVDGLSNKAIAERLCIQPSTVKRHRQNLYEKTGTHDPAGLIACARRWLASELLEMDRLLHSEDLPPEDNHRA
jgi:DNA-binding NarL/FixJ family response regulator